MSPEAAARAARIAQLKKVSDSIHKEFGGKEQEKLVSFLGDDEPIPLQRFTSGCMPLDLALGGGWPEGRITELFGSESSGKTSLLYHAIAAYQKKYPDKNIVWVDSEYSYDPIYAEAIGVDTDFILKYDPRDGNEGFEVMKKLAQEGFGLILVDSVAALGSKEEMEGSMLDSQRMASQARMMSAGLKVLNNIMARNGATIIFTNQMRDKPGVMYGEPTTTSGGRALKFYTSIRVELKTIGTESVGDEKVASKVRAIVKKNKTAAPWRQAEFAITYGVGIDMFIGVFTSALELGIITQQGSWYSFEGNRIGNGKLATMEFFKNDQEAYKRLEEMVRNAPKPTKSSKKPPASAVQAKMDRLAQVGKPAEQRGGNDADGAAGDFSAETVEE